MGRIILAVFTNPVSSDRDSDFNEWYDNTHMKDVLKVPGYIAATRFKLLDKSIIVGAELPHQSYLAIYELETDNVDKAAEQLQAAVQGGGMFISDSLDPSTIRANFYEATTDRVEAD